MSPTRKPDKEDVTQLETLGASEDSIMPRHPSSIAHYRIESMLGSGGMGYVYKAYDPKLERYVALKVLRTDDPDLRPRFLREARLQARIDHENICKVHEVGEADGKPFIAMQFIEGITLTEAMSRLSVEKRVLMILEVTEALEVAHRHGLIHRDIKPTNILITKDKEGEWKPFVLDFGIARDMSSPKMTATGVPLGTPDFMPPEQARGDLARMDGRSDVYSIGATLYMILSGHTPFEGESAFDVLTKVLQSDPPPLREWVPELPEQLNTIVMKCLEKDPGKRYATAGELAADLRRFLEGESISARPATLVDRLHRQVRRNLLASSILGLGVLVTAGLLVLLLWQQHRSRQEAFYAQLFGYEAQSIESALREVYSAPLHDVRAEVASVRTRLSGIERKMREAGAPAQAAGHLALGRGRLALGEYEQALEHLQKAWDSGLQQPATSYALGITLGALYHRRLEETDAIESPTVREATRRQLESQYRDPAVQHLTAAKEAADSPRLVEGFIAFYQQRYAEALEDAHGASQQVRWSYEARKLSGDIQFELARRQVEKGEYAEALKTLSAASEAYVQAADLQRSNERVYVSHCRAWTTAMNAQILRGDSPDASLRRVDDLCDQARNINPDDFDSYLQKARAYQTLGSYLLYSSGEDPRPVLQQSIALADESFKRNPAEASALDIGAFSHARIGEYELTHGIDPAASLQKAISLSTKCLEIRPLNIMAINHLGVAYSMYAESLWKRGGDALGNFRKAVEQYEKASAIQPDDSYAPFNAGIANWFMGAYKMEHGQDPMPEYNRAIGHFERTLELVPNDGSTLSNLGMVYTGLGDYKRILGEDPLPVYRRSVDLRAQALHQMPNNSYLFVGICTALARVADYRVDQGLDPAADLKDARANCEKAISVSPTYYEPYDQMAQVERIAASWAVHEGRDPSRFIQSGERYLKLALERNKEEVSIYRHWADLYLVWADSWKGGTPGAAVAALNNALLKVEEAIRMSPQTADYNAVHGEILLRLARLESDPVVRMKYWEQARASLEKAFQVNSFLQKQYGPLLEEARKSISS